MPNVRKIRKEKSPNVIFADSRPPKRRRDIVTLYLCGRGLPLAKENVESYCRLAERTLATFDLEFNQKSFKRFSKNCRLPLQVYEAWRLLAIAYCLTETEKLRRKIANEERQTGGPVNGSSNLQRLIEDEKSLVGDIHSLGERIKARAMEAIAFRGLKNQNATDEGNRTNSKYADENGRSEWMKYLTPMVKRHRDWSHRGIAVFALRHCPEDLPVRHIDVVREYVKLLRLRLKLPKL